MRFAIPKFAGPVLAAALLLAACSPSNTDAPAQRIALDQVPADAPLPAPAAQPKGAVWVSQAQSASFGVPGSAALLKLACRIGADRTAMLEYTRLDPADPGAEALFALVGAKGIARLPIAAQRIGGESQWTGELPAADPRLEIFAGPATATLPGAGMIELPGSGEPARLIAECRRQGAPPATASASPALQSLPNVASNPALSPADR